MSTVENNLPDIVLRGYFNGKRRAEVATMEAFPETGSILKPSFIYGTRELGFASIPLGLIGRPLEAILNLPGFNQLQNLALLKAALTPPVSVESVGLVAASSGGTGPKESLLKKQNHVTNSNTTNTSSSMAATS